MAIQGFTTIAASATIAVGSRVIQTPFIQNIRVTRNRGEIITKASFTYRTTEDEAGTLNGNAPVVIAFHSKTIFVGYARRINAGPSFNCADEMIVRVDAEDIMYKLVNQRINRRQKLDGLGPIAFITSIKGRPFSGFDDPSDVRDLTGGRSPFNFPTEGPTQAREKFLRDGVNSFGDLHPVVKHSDIIQNRGGVGTGGGGFILHDHTSLDLTSPHGGGPGKSVYGVK